MTRPKITVIFKTENPSAHGWEDRVLLPSGSLTDILAQHICTNSIPEVGDRLREFAELDDETHGRDGDWVVSKVELFSSFDTSDKVVLCYCQYQPITPEWEKLNRGQPVDEMLSTAVG